MQHFSDNYIVRDLVFIGEHITRSLGLVCKESVLSFSLRSRAALLVCHAFPCDKPRVRQAAYTPDDVTIIGQRLIKIS